MDYLEYKGYKGSVEYSKQDNCLFGKVLGLPRDLILYEGATLSELEEDFRNGIDSYIEGCELDGKKPCKPYSGVITLHLTPEEHGELALRAQEQGATLSAFIRKALNKAAVLL